MTHAFTNYSQFRSLPKTKIVSATLGYEATLETCSPDPFSQGAIASKVTWGIKITKMSRGGNIITGYKWFREDGTPVDDGSILQGKMIDNALRLLPSQP